MVFMLADEGLLDVAMKSDYALWPGQLEHHVGVVGHGHKLGERWSPEDSMVGHLEICNFEREVLGSEIFPSPKSDWEGDVSERHR